MRPFEEGQAITKLQEEVDALKQRFDQIEGDFDDGSEAERAHLRIDLAKDRDIELSARLNRMDEELNKIEEDLDRDFAATDGAVERLGERFLAYKTALDKEMEGFDGILRHCINQQRGLAHQIDAQTQNSAGNFVNLAERLDKLETLVVMRMDGHNTRLINLEAHKDEEAASLAQRYPKVKRNKS